MAAFVQKSPTLQANIQQLGQDRVTVKWGSTGQGTYYDESARQLVFDSNSKGHGSQISRSLAHEFGHHAFREPQDISSRSAYVNHQLRDEANATLNNASVRDEILRAGGPDIGISGSNAKTYENIAGDFHSGKISRDSALQGIANAFGNEHPSVAPSVTYNDYYGNFYDTKILPSLRRAPQHPTPDLDVQHEPSRTKIGPDNQMHPDHALLQQIRSGVHAQDQKVGRSYDESSERLSRSLLAACKDSRSDYPQQKNLTGNEITRADHVILGGDNMFVVQGKLGDPAVLRAHVNVAQAINTPIEQSDNKVEAARQTLAQESALVQQQAPRPQQAQQDQPSPSR